MKNVKLTSKKLLVVILAVILFAVCITSSTFSWFTTSTSSNTRPYSSTGGSMSLNLPAQEGGVDEPLKAYDGSDVTMSTYVSNDDGVSFSATAAEPATEGTLGTSSTSTPINRVYYKTEITNNGETDQNVSLYIKNFKPTSTSGANVCVGVNQPIKAFKNYSMAGVTIPSPTKATKNTTTKRIYFKPVSEIPSGNNYSGTRSNWAPPSGTSTTTPYYYAISGNDDAYDHSTRFYRCTASATSVWYADIPWGDNQLYISNTANGNTDYLRTQNFTDLYGDGLSTLQSLCFYLNGTYTDYNNVWAGKYTCTGANVATYFSDITISKADGQTVNISLDSSYYSSTANDGISYGSFRKSGTNYVADTSIFTVNSSGTITPVAAGTGYLRYRTKSEFGEYNDVYVTVKVNAVNTSTETIKNAPIVTNLYIPAGGSQVVYWFIQNGDEMYGRATNNGTYELDGIYLGL